MFLPYGRATNQTRRGRRVYGEIGVKNGMLRTSGKEAREGVCVRAFYQRSTLPVVVQGGRGVSPLVLANQRRDAAATLLVLFPGSLQGQAAWTTIDSH